MGVTTIGFPKIAPGNQLYVPTAPEPVSVAEAPLQIAVGLATAVTVGSGLTVNNKVTEFVQEEALAPVNV